MPHTADLRIEVWSPSRKGCIGEAVLGTVESFLDTSLARAQRIRQCRLTGDRDDDLLLAMLEEIIYVLDTAGEAPVDVELEAITVSPPLAGMVSSRVILRPFAAPKIIGVGSPDSPTGNSLSVSSNRNLDAASTSRTPPTFCSGVEGNHHLPT